MTTLYYTGQAAGVAQVTHVTPSNVEIGDTFTLKINRKPISVMATAATVANVVALFVEAIGSFSNEEPEWAEVSASTGTDDGGNVTHLILTGLDDGTPFTVTATTTNVSTFDVLVTTVREGSAGQNMKQRVRLAHTTSGNFKLLFQAAGGNQETASIAYNASAATVQTALEGLAAIAAGDVVVTKTADGDWTVEFAQAYAATDVPLLIGSFTALSTTGHGIVRVTVITEGQNDTYQTYSLTADPDDVDAFRFKATVTENGVDTDYYSDWIASGGAGATAADIRTALMAITVTSGTAAYDAVEVIGDQGGPWTIVIKEFGSLGGDAVTLDIGDDYYNPSGTLLTGGGAVLTETQAFSTTPTSEVQIVDLPKGPHTDGQFKLTYEGQQTADIAYNASASTVQNALIALSNIGPSDVAVTGNDGGPWTVTFQGALAGDVSPLSGTNGTPNLTNFGVFVEVAQDPQAAVNEIQEVALPDNPTGGTFTLTFNSETTAAINFDATASDVQTALEGLATPVPGDFSVTGPDGGPWMVEFTGSYASTDVSTMTGSGASLTGSNTQGLSASTITTPTGPHHLDNADNYSTGSLPVNSDILIFADIDTGVFYGLTGLSSVTLAELHIRSSYTGHIGLTLTNPSDYYEYRTRAAVLRATKTFVGEGDGQGSEFLYINFSSVQTELIVYNTGQSVDNKTPALNVIGTHASNVMRFFKGSWGIATFTGDTSVVATLQVGYITDRDGDSTGFVGGDADLDTVNIAGGTTKITLDSAAAGTVTVTGGTVTFDGDQGLSQLTMSGEAYAYYNTTGTLGGNTVLSDEATLDFSQDMRTKTVTNPIEVFGQEATVVDPFKVVTSLVIDFNYQNVSVNGSDLGNNVRVTRGTPA